MEEKPLLVDGSGHHSSTLALYPFLTWAGNVRVAFMWLWAVTGKRKLPVVNGRWHLEAHVKQSLELS